MATTAAEVLLDSLIKFVLVLHSGSERLHLLGKTKLQVQKFQDDVQVQHDYFGTLRSDILAIQSHEQQNKNICHRLRGKQRRVIGSYKENIISTQVLL